MSDGLEYLHETVQPLCCRSVRYNRLTVGRHCPWPVYLCRRSHPPRGMVQPCWLVEVYPDRYRLPSRGVNQPCRHGFTLIELLVVVAIIAVLIAVLLPALSSARESARTAVCAANQRSINLGIQQYADDFDSSLPRRRTEPNTQNIYPRDEMWPIQLSAYLGGPDYVGNPSMPIEPGTYLPVLDCPSASFDLEYFDQTAYAMNLFITSMYYANRYPPIQGRCVRREDIRRPGDTVLFLDYDTTRGYGTNLMHPWDWVAGNIDPAASFRHNNRANVGWVDGAVRSVELAELEKGYDETSIVTYWNLDYYYKPWDPFEE